MKPSNESKAVFISSLLESVSPSQIEGLLADAKSKLLMSKPKLAPALYDAKESFNYQLNGLLDRDYPELSRMNERQFIDLISSLRPMNRDFISSPETLPYLIVIPHSMVSIYDQLSCKNNEILGYTFLDIRNIRRVDDTIKHTKPYLISDVSCGTSMRGFSADKGAKQIFSSGRTPLNLEEGMALFTHAPQILYYQGLIFAGSKHKDDGVLDIYLYGGKAKLKRERREDADSRWGIPSYIDQIL